MDGVATPIIGRPRPLPGHDTPNPAYHPHTLNYEEPPMYDWGPRNPVWEHKYIHSDYAYWRRRNPEATDDPGKSN